MNPYWLHNTKAKIHEWFDRHFRKNHYYESCEEAEEESVRRMLESWMYYEAMK